MNLTKSLYSIPHNSPLFSYFKPLIYTIETHFHNGQDKTPPFFKKKEMGAFNMAKEGKQYALWFIIGWGLKNNMKKHFIYTS